MKILIATGIYPPEVGGPATYTKLMEEHLPSLGWHVEALPFSAVRRLPKLVRHLAFLWRVIRRGRGVDIIYAQDVASVGLPALIGARLIGKQFAVRVPGDYAWEQGRQRFGITDSIDDFQNRRYGFFVEFLRAVQRFVVRHADLAITPSDYFTRLVSGWLPRENSAIVHTVYNGIQLPKDLQSRETTRTTIGIALSDKVIVSAGRLVPWKGFDVLIEIASALHEEDASWKLYILGDGPERTNLESAIAKHHAKDFVILTGEKTRNEMFSYCIAADVFTLNSSFESFSFQAVEVMSTGTPFIATNIGSLPELVRDGEEGILVAPDDKEAFIQAIRRIMADEVFRRAITEAAIDKSRMFSIQETVRKTASLLQKLYGKQ